MSERRCYKVGSSFAIERPETGETNIYVNTLMVTESKGDKIKIVDNNGLIISHELDFTDYKDKQGVQLGIDVEATLAALEAVMSSFSGGVDVVDVSTADAVFATDGSGTHVDLQQAIDDVSAGGGGLVYMKDSFVGDISAKVGVTLVGSHREMTSLGVLTIDIGTDGGNRTDHKFAAKNIRVSRVVFQGNFAQEAHLENIMEYHGDNGSSMLINNNAIGASGLGSKISIKNYRIWDAAANNNALIDVQGGWLEIIDELEAEKGNPDGVAIANNAGVVTSVGKTIITGKVESYSPGNSSGISISLPDFLITTNTVSPFLTDGAGLLNLGRGGVIGIAGSLNPANSIADMVTGFGGFAYTPDLTTPLGVIKNSSTGSTTNGSAGAIIYDPVDAIKSVIATGAVQGLGLVDKVENEVVTLKDLKSGHAAIDLSYDQGDGSILIGLDEAELPAGGGGATQEINSGFISDVNYDAANDGAWDASSVDRSYINGGHSNDGTREVIAAGVAEFRALSYDIDVGSNFIIDFDHDANGSGNGDGGLNGVFWGIEVNAGGRRTRIGLKTDAGDGNTLKIFEGMSNTFLAPLKDQNYDFSRSKWRLKREGQLVIFYIDGVEQLICKWNDITTATANAARVAVGRMQSTASPDDAYIYEVDILTY